MTAVIGSIEKEAKAASHESAAMMVNRLVEIDDEVEERLAGLEINEEVEVPCSLRVVRCGAEQAQIVDAPLLGNRMQLADESRLKHSVFMLSRPRPRSLETARVVVEIPNNG